MRIRCAWKKFRELSPILTARGASLTLKGKIYSTCIRSSMIYGRETWPMKVEDKQRLERAERMMVRHMCGVTLKDKKSSEELRQRLGIDSVSDVIRSRLRWFGHVERKEDGRRLVRGWRYLVGEVEVGAGRHGERTCVAEDMKVLGLEERDVQDRLKWRRGILGKPSDPCKHGNNRR